MSDPERTVTVFACTAEDFHPYECDGPGKCRHCDRRFMPDTNNAGDHDPATCPLCDPAYDHAPTAQRRRDAHGKRPTRR